MISTLGDGWVSGGMMCCVDDGLGLMMGTLPLSSSMMFGRD